MTQKQKLTELRLAKASAKRARRQRQKSSVMDSPVCRGFLKTFCVDPRPDPVMQAGAIHWMPTPEELAPPPPFLTSAPGLSKSPSK